MKARRIEQPRPPTLTQRLIEPLQTKGRYRRDVFWVFFIVFGIPSTLLQNVITQRMADWMMLPMGEPFPWMDLASPVALLLGLSWVHFTATVKRLHDRDKSGVWSLVAAIPVVGLAYLVIECGFLPSVDSGNRYGREAKDLRNLLL